MKKRKILFDFLTEKEMKNVSGSTDSGEEEIEFGCTACTPGCEYYCSCCGGCLIGSEAFGKPVKYVGRVSRSICRCN